MRLKFEPVKSCPTAVVFQLRAEKQLWVVENPEFVEWIALIIDKGVEADWFRSHIGRYMDITTYGTHLLLTDNPLSFRYKEGFEFPTKCPDNMFALVSITLDADSVSLTLTQETE